MRAISEDDNLNDSTCDPEGVDWESDEDSEDDGALHEDGLSDSEFDDRKAQGRCDRQRFDTFDAYTRCDRQRFETFDAYETEEVPPSPRRIVPMMSEQRPEMIPVLSGQGTFGLVTATPSNPIMIICCGRNPQNMNVGMPIQTCASIREEIPTTAPTPAPVAAP